MSPKTLLHICNTFLNCKTTDLVSTWVDEEREDVAKAATAIYHNLEKGAVLFEEPHPKWGSYMAVEVVKLPNDVCVIFQNGMPDGIWYKKEDYNKIVSLPLKENF